ncbi:MAG: Multidrug transporter [Parachlamydiales bacterium]|nr:Multidrug transporter [Parachlamydiales bacterium]
MILAFALGSIVGPFLSGLTVSFGLIMPFLFAATLSCLNVFGLSVFFRETHERKAHKILWLSLLTSFTFLLRDDRTRKLAVVFLVFQFAFGFYFQSISLVLQEVYHLVPAQISSFFIVIGLSVGVFSNLSIWFSVLLSAAFFFLSGILIRLFEEKSSTPV